MFDFKNSIALEHMFHAYAKTDGTYDFPNSREGDILRRCKKEIETLLERSDNSNYEAKPKLPSFEGEKEMYLGQARYPTWTYVKWLEKQLSNFS